MLYMNIAKTGRRILSPEKLGWSVAAVEIPQLPSAPATAWSDHMPAGRALTTSLRPELAPADDRTDLLMVLGRANRGEPLYTLAARRVPGLPCTVEAKALRRTDGQLAIAVIATVEDGRRMAIGDLPDGHPEAMTQAVAAVCGTLTLEARNGYMREGIPCVNAAEETVARLAAAEWLRGDVPPATTTRRPRNTGNANLTMAKAAKNDEFYTQLPGIEREMTAYWVHNKDVFADKTILLPCDDPEWSNFTRFFAHNFERFGIKKLISTSYTSGGRGRKFVLERGDGQIDLDDLQWEHLDGDGDFRSEEVTALRDEADMVITNPPFSLFREFMVWLVDGDVQYSVIGSMNAVTYKEIFPLIKDNLMWKGATANSTDLVFEVPAHAEVKQSDMDKAKRLGHPSENGRKFTRLGNARWFTNISHGKRNRPLQLMTMRDNLIYSRRKKIREQGYPEYDNYPEGIEVAFTESIPSDYDGVMGVPISFLDKHNPEQFEILGCSSDYGRPDGWSEDVKMDPSVNGRDIYRRILIRHRKSVAPSDDEEA